MPSESRTIFSGFQSIFLALAQGVVNAPAWLALERMVAEMNAEHVHQINGLATPASFETAAIMLKNAFKGRDALRHWSELQDGCGFLFAHHSVQAKRC